MCYASILASAKARRRSAPMFIRHRRRPGGVPILKTQAIVYHPKYGRGSGSNVRRQRRKLGSGVPFGTSLSPRDSGNQPGAERRAAGVSAEEVSARSFHFVYGFLSPLFDVVADVLCTLLDTV